MEPGAEGRIGKTDAATAASLGAAIMLEILSAEVAYNYSLAVAQIHFEAEPL